MDTKRSRLSPLELNNKVISFSELMKAEIGERAVQNLRRGRHIHPPSISPHQDILQRLRKKTSSQEDPSRTPSFANDGNRRSKQ